MPSQRLRQVPGRIVTNRVELERISHIFKSVYRLQDTAARAEVILQVRQELQIQGFDDFRDSAKKISRVLGASYRAVTIDEEGFKVGSRVFYYRRKAVINSISQLFNLSLKFTDGQTPEYLQNISPSYVKKRT